MIDLLLKQDKTDPASRIEALVATLEVRLQRAFLDVVRQVKNRRTLTQIADLLERGQFVEALREAFESGAAIASEVAAGYGIAGRSTAGALSRMLEVVVAFDQTNYRAVDQMRRQSLELIREFSARQVAATREALVMGVQSGANPVEQARNFRDSIGLTRRQVRAVENYRRLLRAGSSEALDRALRDRRFDPTVARAISSGKPLSDAQIDRMVERYRARYLKYRSETIARDQALAAVHSANDEAYRQAIEAGHVRAEELVQEWNTREDGRERSTHRVMNRQKRRFGVPFVTGAGVLLRYPGDMSAPAEERVQCRCAVSTRIQPVEA